MIWIHGIAADLSSMHPNRIPTEIVISHMGVRVITDYEAVCPTISDKESRQRWC